MKLMVQVPTGMRISDDQLINLLAQRSKQFRDKHVGPCDDIVEVDGSYLPIQYKMGTHPIGSDVYGKPVPQSLYEAHNQFKELINLIELEKVVTILQ